MKNQKKPGLSRAGKTFLCLALSLAMIITMMPADALAADGSSSGEHTSETKDSSLEEGLLSTEEVVSGADTAAVSTETGSDDTASESTVPGDQDAAEDSSGETSSAAASSGDETSSGTEMDTEEDSTGVTASGDVTEEDEDTSAQTSDETDNVQEESESGAIEDILDSWRYQNGTVIAHPNTDSDSSDLQTLSSAYSTWKKSYGTSYLGIVSGSTTTKVKISGAVRVGIDVSKWQGDIDWAKVAAAGIDYAIIRCGYGSNYTSQDDAYFLENVEGALENGIEIGIYLYSYATSTSAAKSEAKHVIRLLESADLDPDDLDLPVFLDMEDSTQASLSASKLGSIAETFCDAIEAEGYAVGIYANKNWWTNYLTDSRFTDEGWYKWVARYPTTTSITSAGVDDTDIWQFTSSGTVSGISGSVDVNFDYRGSDYYACAKPGNVTLSSATLASTYTSVTLKWTEVGNATGYQIYRKTGSGSWKKIAQISDNETLTYKDTGLSTGTTYSYRIRAYRLDSSGTYTYGSYSGTKSVTTKPSQVTISSAALSTSLTTATLTWKKLSNVDGYKIYRSTDGGSTYKLVKTISSASTVTWKDTGLSLGKTYKYKIRAYKTVSYTTTVVKETTSDDTDTSDSDTDDSSDDSSPEVEYETVTTYSTLYGSYSSAKSLTTRPTKVTISSAKTTTGGYVQVKWKKTSNATGYVIYRSVNGGSYSKVKTISSSSTVSWTDKSVSAGKVYRYKIRSYKKSGSTTVYSSSYSSVKKVTAKPAKVTISSIKSTKSRSGTVKWKKVSGATGYQVAYRRKGSSKWYYVTVKTNSKTFTSLIKKNYYVKVRAYKTYNGKKYYGSWSSTKAMKVK